MFHMLKVGFLIPGIWKILPFERVLNAFSQSARFRLGVQSLITFSATLAPFSNTSHSKEVVYSEFRNHPVYSWPRLSFSPAGLLVDIIWSGSCHSCRGEEGNIRVRLEPSTVTEFCKTAWASSRLRWLQQTSVVVTNCYCHHYGS